MHFFRHLPNELPADGDVLTTPHLMALFIRGNGFACSEDSSDRAPSRTPCYEESSDSGNGVGDARHEKRDLSLPKYTSGEALLKRMLAFMDVNTVQMIEFLFYTTSLEKTPLWKIVKKICDMSEDERCHQLANFRVYKNILDGKHMSAYLSTLGSYVLCFHRQEIGRKEEELHEPGPTEVVHRDDIEEEHDLFSRFRCSSTSDLPPSPPKLRRSDNQPREPFS